MRILAITNHLESSVALFSGKTTLAASEERFTRQKNQDGMPILAINWVLKEAQITLEEIDRIYFCSISSINPPGELVNLLKEEIRLSENNYDRNIIINRLGSELLYNSTVMGIFYEWADQNKIPKNKIFFVDHHEAHARSAVNFYGLQDAEVFTCDGKGGFTSSAVWNLENNNLTNISRNLSHNSLGYFYGNVTIGLGFQAERHEGKVTGLAAMAKVPADYNRINPFEVLDGKIRISKFNGIYMPFFNRETENLWSLKEFNNSLLGWSREEAAAAAQAILEETVLEWLAQNISSKSSSICLSGGVFGNVKLNQKIRENFPDKNIYIAPAMSDMGLVLGIPLDKNPNLESSQGMYLGPDFSDQQIIEILNQEKLSYEIIDSTDAIVEKCIELFNNDSPIGLFLGRMEFGPRALCNRSIIFPAKSKKANELLNQRLMRSDFMPFAPVVLDTMADKCFEGYENRDLSAHFMTTTYKCTPYFQELSEAVVHVDGTARPQVLREKDNFWFYHFLKKYTNHTGEPCLINTSFNNHEEPIVCKPQDAILSFRRGNVDALIFNGKFLVTNL